MIYKKNIWLIILDSDQSTKSISFQKNSNEQLLTNTNSYVKKLVSTKELHIFGPHNILNILAALLLAHTLPVAWEPLIQVAKEYTGASHRIEFVHKINNINFDKIYINSLL